MVSLTCTLCCQFQQFVTCHHVTVYGVTDLYFVLSVSTVCDVLSCDCFGVTDLYFVLSVSTVCDVLSCDCIWCH